MSPQMMPNYQYMTSLGSEYFTQPLIEKYGFENVVWPIVLIEKDKITSYLYETNALFQLNHDADHRPQSKSGHPNFQLNYITDPRVIIPGNLHLSEFIDAKYNCSYDFILTTDDYATVDIDYAWRTNETDWKALELTTVWMPLGNEKEAERLVKMFTRRPSWKGPRGPHGLRKLIDACTDLNMQYYMAVVNSNKKVSNELIVDGNAYWFPLTHQNIDKILKGEAPDSAQFGKFNDHLNWL